MINNFYKELKIRHYLENNDNLESKKAIDCSLGTNPFINSGYIGPNYSKLKNKIIEVIKEDMDVSLNIDNISFGSWHNGNIKKFVSIYDR